jgi:hypothetical protein
MDAYSWTFPAGGKMASISKTFFLCCRLNYCAKLDVAKQRLATRVKTLGWAGDGMSVDRDEPGIRLASLLLGRN